MPYIQSNGGLKDLVVIQTATQYLDERNKRGINPGIRFKAITGPINMTTDKTSRPKRKAEDPLPAELQLFTDSTGRKKGLDFLDLRVPFPSDKTKSVGNRIGAGLAQAIGDKQQEVEPDDQTMAPRKSHRMKREISLLSSYACMRRMGTLLAPAALAPSDRPKTME